MQSITRSARDTVVRLGLADMAFWLYGQATRLKPSTVARNRYLRRHGAGDGLPIPPADLIFLVAGTTDVSWFLRGGALGMTSIADVLAKNGLAIAEQRAILDFGCGCGRVLRNWYQLPHTRVCGTDYNRRLIEWCRDNLPFAQFDVNQLKPPLAYADGEFDLVYALSVFTHLTQELQSSWIRELSRVVRPGGHMIISTHGEVYMHRLNDSERRRFLDGQLVVKNNTKSPGSNTCSAYHPQSFVRDQLAKGLELVEFRANGAEGNPQQDLYLFRKPR